eukprot:scaffold32482_cov72-Phaeocystis_antarctica.AAC.2
MRGSDSARRAAAERLPAARANRMGAVRLTPLRQRAASLVPRLWTALELEPAWRRRAGTPAGLCARCVLWDPDAHETSCYAHGRPQGGPLPGTREWAAGTDGVLPPTTCRADFMPAAGTELLPPLCVREVAAEVSLQLVDARSGAEHTAWLPPISLDALSVDPVPAAITQAMCVDSRAPPAAAEGRFLALPQPCTLVSAAAPDQKFCCAHPSEVPPYNANLTASVLSGDEMFRRLAMVTC